MTVESPNPDTCTRGSRAISPMARLPRKAMSMEMKYVPAIISPLAAICSTVAPA